MKILMIHQDMREPGQGGGAESLLRDQTRALSALGHEIVWMHDGIIERVVQAHQPDVLHFMTLHERWADLAPLVWAQQQGIPHIIHVQDYWPFCLLEGETVFRDGQPVPIEQVEVGDTVLASGVDAVVQQRFDRLYEGQAVSIKPQGLWPVRFTGEHPVLLVRREVIRHQRTINAGRRYNIANGVAHIEPEPLKVLPEWVAASDVREGDYLCIQPMTDAQDWTINLDEWAKSLGQGARRKYKPISVDEDVAYFLGWYMAEGHSDLNPSLSLGVSDEPYVNDLIRIIEQKCRTKVARADRPDVSCIVLKLANRPMARMLKQLFGPNAREKHIPSQVLRLPVSVLRAFLIGYLLGDGSVTAHGNERVRATFVTVSRALMQSLCLALLKIGVMPSSVCFTPSHTFTIRGRTYTNAGCYNIEVGGSQLEHLGIDSGTTISKRRFEQVNGMFLVPIRRIERTEYTGKVYNLHTSNQTFDVPFITHNCSPRMLLVNGDQSCAAVHGICDNACGGRRDNYLPILNRSFVVAGNAYTAEIYRRNGLRCDAVVELGIDTELFHPEPASRTETPSVWTSAAWPSFPTKGMHVLERAVRGTGLSVKLLSGISRERVAEGLRRAHIYVFPSCYEETFGLCLCEAMASGCAVVASAVAGTRAQVHDGMGMLVPPRDPMALRDAIVSLLSDPMRCREMGEAARMHAVVEHSLLAMGKRWEAAYRRVISGVK